MNENLEQLISMMKNASAAENPIAETKKAKKSRKKPVPKSLRDKIWEKHFGKSMEGMCLCGDAILYHKNYECGHIISEANDGKTVESNLRPICRTCNRSMGTKNLDEFFTSFEKPKLPAEKVCDTNENPDANLDEIPEDEEKTPPKKKVVKKAAVKKATVKKPSAKKSVAEKPAAKKATAKKPSAKSSAKSTVKKPKTITKTIKTTTTTTTTKNGVKKPKTVVKVTTISEMEKDD